MFRTADFKTDYLGARLDATINQFSKFLDSRFARRGLDLNAQWTATTCAESPA